MKVFVVNASPRKGGNCAILIEEMCKVFKSHKVDISLMEIGIKDIRGCISCGSCAKSGKCVFDDEVNKAATILEESDGFVVVSPVYYSSPNGTIISFLDRLSTPIKNTSSSN